MTIEKIPNGAELCLKVSGRLDTATAPQLENEIKQLNGVNKLILDLLDLEYISSAGLRVILGAQKIMSRQGEMIVKNVSETITEIFEITGFVDILNIE